MPNVEVRDAAGKLLKTYQIITGDDGTFIKDAYLFDLAKLNAIEDELVTEDNADQLTFNVVD